MLECRQAADIQKLLANLLLVWQSWSVRCSATLRLHFLFRLRISFKFLLGSLRSTSMSRCSWNVSSLERKKDRFLGWKKTELSLLCLSVADRSVRCRLQRWVRSQERHRMPRIWCACATPPPYPRASRTPFWSIRQKW